MHIPDTKPCAPQRRLALLPLLILNHRRRLVVLGLLIACESRQHRAQEVEGTNTPTTLSADTLFLNLTRFVSLILRQCFLSLDLRLRLFE